MLYLIRFVSITIGNTAKWLGGLFSRKLPTKRRVMLQRELEIHKSKNGDTENQTIIIRWNRVELHDQGSAPIERNFVAADAALRSSE